jgi:hypothetical protein
MRERAVPEVVEQRGSQAVCACFVVESLRGGQLVAAGVDSVLKRLHDVRRSHRVSEARMFRPGKDQ